MKEPSGIALWRARHISVVRAEERRKRAASVRAIEARYVVMACVTVIATAVGFWLSYAGLHSFGQRAGLRGPEAWAWPSSVDLFILAGELGITISTLRDGATDWRAWLYFGAGAGPSVTFNVLHVLHILAWAKYAVAATPPLAAVLALAALMQQIISLPEALRHMHARQETDQPDTILAPIPPDAETAALTSLRATLAAGNPWSQNQLMTRFGLTRAQATKLRDMVTAESNGQHPQDPPDGAPDPAA
jgi:hypothetical protein